MSGYLPPGCTQRECDQAQPGYWDEPEPDFEPEPGWYVGENRTDLLCELVADEFEMGLERPPQPCPKCWGDKGFDVPHGIDYRNGDLLTHWVICTYCDETGDDPESESPPITQDDLDDMAGSVDDVY